MRAGIVRFALVVEGPVVLLLSRFGETIDWGTEPFTMPPGSPAERGWLATPRLDERDALSVVMVDAGTGLVRALRMLVLPANFTYELRRATRQQAAAETDVYDAAFEELQHRYPTLEALVEHAVVTCTDSGETEGKPWRR